MKWEPIENLDTKNHKKDWVIVKDKRKNVFAVYITEDTLEWPPYEIYGKSIGYPTHYLCRESKIVTFPCADS